MPSVLIVPLPCDDLVETVHAEFVVSVIKLDNITPTLATVADH